MTPGDVLAQLPNAMHDASIREMRVQLGRQLVTLDVDFWVGDVDSENEGKREAHRAGKLLLAGTGAMHSRRWSDCRRVSCGDGAAR